MKKIQVVFVVAVGLLAPLCGRAEVAAVSPAMSGTLLSTNLGAAMVKLDAAMSINAGSTMTGGIHALIPCPGGDCGSDPISGLPCTSSPENPTAVLGLLGLVGLMLGRIGYGRLRVRRTAAAAA